jgi:hypothetical protein
MDPLTTANGLPVDIVEDVIAVGSDIYMATPAGLFIWDSTAQTGTTMSVRDGLMGQSTWGLTTFGFSAGGGSPMLAISHDGRGSERPGVTLLSTSSQQVDSTHRFDQLPSNTSGQPNLLFEPSRGVLFHGTRTSFRGIRPQILENDLPKCSPSL